jgi:anti-sigma regulatory factor (Ser/Thr protein kinase)
VALNATAAYAVEDTTQIGEPRRAVLELAQPFGFSEARAGQAALIVTELATNLTKHATGGEILLRPIHHDGVSRTAKGIEILAIDRGPGVRDLSLARQDGYSTAGTLGHGLGSVERQADFFQVYSQPTGTVVLARLWVNRPVADRRQFPYEIGAVAVSHPGEDISGDSWDWSMRDGRFAIMVADGLGHGVMAHDAAAAAIDVFRHFHEESPSRVITDAHASLRATRGAAIAMVAVDTDRGVASYCGLGNIGAVIVPADGPRRSMVSQNGTAGHVASRILEFNYPVPRQSILVMFSDGLASQWDLDRYPGLRTRDPSVIAAILYRDFSRRRDDVTVVVAKGR